jgi:hypothetical protein
MKTIEEVLALYQPEPLALPRCQLHMELIKPVKSYVFKNHALQLSAEVDYMTNEFRDVPRGKKRPTGFVFVLYTDDLGPLQKNAPGPMMLGPLSHIVSNPFNWHALRMNVAAYLSGKQVLRLHLQQISAGNHVYFPNYNAQLVETLLRHYAALNAPVPHIDATPVTGNVVPNFALKPYGQDLFTQTT